MREDNLVALFLGSILGGALVASVFANNRLRKQQLAMAEQTFEKVRALVEVFGKIRKDITYLKKLAQQNEGGMNKAQVAELNRILDGAKQEADSIDELTPDEIDEVENPPVEEPGEEPGEETPETPEQPQEPETPTTPEEPTTPTTPGEEGQEGQQNRQ